MDEITITELNDCSKAEFVETLRNIYEHSPWVAEAAWSDRPFDSIGELQNCMKRVVNTASDKKKRELLLAHPDLGDQTEITDHSQKEQESAGLDSLSPSLYEEFQCLNETYRDKFGFPFILAVKGRSPEDIKDTMESRVSNSEAEEFQTAITEVHTIAEIRINELIVS